MIGRARRRDHLARRLSRSRFFGAWSRRPRSFVQQVESGQASMRTARCGGHADVTSISRSRRSSRGALLPDLILMVGAMLLLLVSAWRQEIAAAARLVGMLSIVALPDHLRRHRVALARAAPRASAGIIAVDGFRWATDLHPARGTIIAAALMIDYSEREQLVSAESYVLHAAGAGGMMLLAAARDLIVVFLGIELMSIASLRARGTRPPQQPRRRRRRSSISCWARSRRASCSTASRSCTAPPDPRTSPTIGRPSPETTFNNPLLLAGIGAADRRLRLQGRSRAVPHVDAGRLRGRADAGHRLHGRGREGGCIRRVPSRLDRGVSRRHGGVAFSR